MDTLRCSPFVGLASLPLTTVEGVVESLEPAIILEFAPVGDEVLLDVVFELVSLGVYGYAECGGNLGEVRLALSLEGALEGGGGGGHG